MTNVLSENQLAQLSELGYLKLPAAIPAHDALAMRARMWEALAVGGADPADRSTWRTVDRKALKRAVQRDAFAAYASSTVRAVADQLLGAGGWGPPAHWGLTMVTFPEDGEWSVPHRGWHLDSSPRTGPADQLIRTFALLGTQEAGGGATLIVSGSHRSGGHEDASAALGQHRAHGVSRAAGGTLASGDAGVDGLFRPGEEPGRSRWLMTDRVSWTESKVGSSSSPVRPVTSISCIPGTLSTASSNSRDQPRLMLMMALYRAGYQIAATDGQSP